MAVKSYKPYTPSRRYYETLERTNDKLKETPSYLLKIIRRKGGRNNLGRVTAPRRGGGNKRYYRIIDFKRDKRDIPGKIVSVEYDPNRSANISLVLYKDGEYRYIIAPEGIKLGQEVIASENAPLSLGNAMPLFKIPVGVEIHNVQLYPEKRGAMVRSAGTAAQILAKEGDYVFVKLPSGEVRKILSVCYATIGRVSNIDYNKVSIGKAGRVRHRGRRPRVRAVAKNPVDHPMGGGEGRSSGGRPPCSANGLIAKGKKTRKKHKFSDKFIVKRRK